MYFCGRIEDTLSENIFEVKEALCLSCNVENLRNFQNVHKEGIVVLTHTAWAAIIISVYGVFSGPSTFNMACSTTLFLSAKEKTITHIHI